MLGLISRHCPRMLVPPFGRPGVEARMASRPVVMADRVFSPTEAKGGAELVPSKTAMVFIEYQNEFASEVTLTLRG